MKKITFKTLSGENFLSIGKEITIPLNKGLITAISGINKDKENDGNGVGKCVDKKTNIDVCIYDDAVLKDLKNFLKK